MKRAALLLAACGGSHELPAPPRAEVALVRAQPNRDVDVLFLIDDSVATAEYQFDLKSNFPAFVETLASLPDGLPNLHIGVTTSDLGTRGADDAAPGPAIGSGPGACSGEGKAGVLQTYGSTALTDKFIIDTATAKNFTGTLEDVFTQIASVGSNGCGFEQHIEAVRRALDDNPANAGFLRPSAGLAVIIVGDEDDCSMAHSALLGADNATLGALASFRCTRFGITCDGGGETPDAMNMLGAKSFCHSNDASAYLTDLPRYVQFLTGLKADPDDVMLAAIVGPPEPVVVEARTLPGSTGGAVPALAHSCLYQPSPTDTVAADPAVRIAELATKIRRHAVDTVCKQDLSPALIEIARQIRGLTGDSCLTQDIAYPPADCVVFDEVDGTQTQIPPCPAAGDCFTIEVDPTCPGQQLRLNVQRAVPPRERTDTSVRCNQ